MPEYHVTDPRSNRTVVLRGDSPPTEQELHQVFARINGEQRDGARTVRGQMFEKAVDWLPAAAGTLGGVVGGIGGTVAGMGVGGVPGAIGGAALGGAAGEAGKQLLNRAMGKPAPSTPAEAARGIVKETAVQGGAQAVGAGIGKGMAKAGPWLMQTALKPTAAVLKEYRTTAPRLVKTLLDEGVNVTQGGLEKLQRIFDATNEEIRQAVQGATGSIDKKNVAARALTTAGQFSKQVNPTKDLQSVGETVEEFINHPVYKGNLSVPEAQALKIGTYREIGKKYGDVAPAAIETQKALARGLKEEIAAEVPSVSALNAKDSDVMAAMDAVGRRVAQSGNRDPVGFAWVTQHPVTFLASLIDRNPAVKSLLARGLYNKAASAAHVSPMAIRAAVKAVASQSSGDGADRGGGFLQE